jgi:hypothetical protein
VDPIIIGIIVHFRFHSRIIIIIIIMTTTMKMDKIIVNRILRTSIV